MHFAHDGRDPGAVGAHPRLPIFAGSHRSQRFLKYVVEKSFDPGSDALKEYTIAVDVFERDASYDSSIDATVRVEAGRLRSRLHEYYAEDGKDDPLIIDVPKGGYRATVTKRPVAARLWTDGASSGHSIRRAGGPARGEPEAKHMDCGGMHRVSDRPDCGWVALRQQRHAATPAPIAMAILPFANQTGVAANGYLSEGMTQNLIRQCSEIPPLKVMSRAAVDRVNRDSAASQLGVTILLTGALRKNADGDLVVDAELSNLKDGSVLRSREYLADRRTCDRCRRTCAGCHRGFGH